MLIHLKESHANYGVISPNNIFYKTFNLTFRISTILYSN